MLFSIKPDRPARWIPAVVVTLLILLAGPIRAERYEEIEVKDGGTIEGRVTYEGERPQLTLVVSSDQHVCLHEGGEVTSPRLRVAEDGGVAQAVVYLRNIARGKPLDRLEAPLQLDQKGCLYDPFVQVMPQKGVLTLVNSDPLNHNVHARQEGQRDPFNYAMPNSSWPEKQTIQKRMIRPGLVHIGCDVHMWMSAYLFVVEHPYYAVTGDGGGFELTDVPPGDYELAVWHAGWEATLERDSKGQMTGYSYSAPVESVQPITVVANQTTKANFVLGQTAP